MCCHPSKWKQTFFQLDNNQETRNGLRLKDPQVSDPVCVYVSTGWESRVETTEQKELKRGQSGTSDVHREGSMQTDAAGGAQTHIPDSRSVFGLPGSFFGTDATSILLSISRYRLFLPWSSHNTPPPAPLLLHLLALRLCPRGFSPRSPPGLFQLRLHIPPPPKSITSKPI